MLYSDGYWEVHDGTMIDNGTGFPLLAHKIKEALFRKILTEMQPGDILDVYDRRGNIETTMKLLEE